MTPHTEPRQASSFLLAPPWLTGSVPVAALAALAWVVLAGLDEPLFFFFNGLSRITGPAPWAHITILGDGLVCAVLLLLWVGRRPDRVWAGLLGAAVMVAVLHGTKAILDMPRPLGVLPMDMVEVIGPGFRRGAFPSGHTATAFLFAGVWALSLRRPTHALFPLALAAAVGVSRMVVGVHWPSDVLAGAALGWVAAWLGLRWAGRARWGVNPLGRRALAGALMACAVVLLVVDHTGYPGILLFQRALALSCLVWGGLGLFRDIRGSSGGAGERGESAPF
jgi:membrane-associated phospholipid phosphatase